MNQAEICAPFLVMLLLTLVVRLYMYVCRLPFVFSSEFKPDCGTSLELDMVSPAGIVHPRIT